MNEEVATPWWRSTLKGLAILLGLLALAGLLMGFIVVVARFLDNVRMPTTYTAAPASNPPEAEQNARTRVPMPYAPQSWPDTPSNRPGGGMGGARASGGGRSAPQPPSPPVGISVEEYRAAADSGKKIYLPNPKGECELSGTSTENSVRALESCFAQQAAR